jgi:hypothetical protein
MQLLAIAGEIECHAARGGVKQMAARLFRNDL